MAIKKIGLLFSGQGAQKKGMGESLYDAFSASRELYDEADRILGWSLTRLCFEGPEAELVQTRVCQPALFVHGLAAVAALESRGEEAPEFSAALGLSLGEVTALTAGGSFSFSTGLRIVAKRGELMQSACEKTDGAMASLIGVPQEEVEALCEEFDIDLANLNCPGQLVVSGDRKKVSAAVDEGKRRGFKRVIPLNVAGAYHSRLMNSARDGFAAYLGEIAIESPRFPIFSNTTGDVVSGPEEIRSALIEQIVSPVQWEQCMRAAAAKGIRTFCECGPGGVLTGLARRTDPELKVLPLAEAGDIDSFSSQL